MYSENVWLSWSLLLFATTGIITLEGDEVEFVVVVEENVEGRFLSAGEKDESVNDDKEPVDEESEVMVSVLDIVRSCCVVGEAGAAAAAVVARTNSSSVNFVLVVVCSTSPVLCIFGVDNEDCCCCCLP